MNSENKQEKIIDEIIFPVVEENVTISKQIIETGGVQISKHITEANEPLAISTFQDEVTVTRIPVDKFVDEVPEPVRYEGDVMIIPVLQEVFVKRILLVEEIYVTKKRTHKDEVQNVLLRKEEIIINNKNNP